MLKNHTILELKKNERLYQLFLSADSPLGEVHDVLHEMKCYLINLMAERSRPQEEQKIEEDPKIDPQPGVA